MKRSLKKRHSSRSPRMEPVDDSVVKELTATFKVFDKDGDGKISKCELGTVLRSLGDDLSDDELDAVIVKVDGNGDGFIDLEEFIRFHTPVHNSKDEIIQSKDDSEETLALQDAFDVFDVDKNGFISAEDLQRVMRSLGDKKTSLAECRHMIKCVDKDGDHMVDFNEFQYLLSSAFDC